MIFLYKLKKIISQYLNSFLTRKCVFNINILIAGCWFLHS